MDDPAGIVVGSGIAVGDCAGSRVNEYGLAFGYGAGGRCVELPVERDGSAGSLSVSTLSLVERREDCAGYGALNKADKSGSGLACGLEGGGSACSGLAEVKAKAPAVSVPSEM